VAVIFCFMAQEQGFSDYRYRHDRHWSECFLELCIMREGEEVQYSSVDTNRPGPVKIQNCEEKCLLLLQVTLPLVLQNSRHSCIKHPF
jgi:hypothetical protein